jgi:hypothetical protein
MKVRVKIEPRTLQGQKPTNSSSSMTFMIDVQFGNFVVWLHGLPVVTGTGEY